MADDQKKKEKKAQFSREEIALELTEDTTRYGEFIPSFYNWITPEEQKETVEKLVHLQNHPVKRDLL